MKTRIGQGAVEFGLTSTLVVFMLIGTIDIFNLAITYIQMTAFGTESLNRNLRGRCSGGHVQQCLLNDLVRPNDGTGDYLKRFFFSHIGGKTCYVPYKKNGNPAYYGSRNGGTLVKETGSPWCYEMTRDVPLLMGHMFFKKKGEMAELSKVLCAIQEEPSLNSSGSKTKNGSSCRSNQ